MTTYRNLLLWGWAMLTSVAPYAHPGIGLVYDGANTIYYTDLEHVWKVDVESGGKEIFVEGVHTHELFLDEEGNLYGEHYWYVEPEQRFKHYVWRVDKGGGFQKIREDRYGENEDFGYVRDTAFRAYELRAENEVYQLIRQDSTSDEVLRTLSLRRPTWRYLTETNELLVVDFPGIYRASTAGLEVVAENVSRRRFPFSAQSKLHNIYAPWTDDQGTVYAAIYGGRVVARINKNGVIDHPVKSSFLWSPVNGVFDRDNNLWLMECRLGGAIRLRKISPAERKGNTSFLLENILMIGFAVLLLGSGYAYFQKRKNHPALR